MVTIVLVLDQNDFNLGSGVARLQSTGRRSTQGSRFEEICLPFSSCNFNCRIASTRKVYREERIRDQSSIEEYKGAEGGRGGGVRELRVSLSIRPSLSLPPLLFTNSAQRQTFILQILLVFAH